jgi:non-specific serine/threonine protein kinase
LIASLGDTSLIQQQTWGGEARFVMLETIRTFAWGRLVAGGEEEAAGDAHAAWVLSLAEPAEMAVAVPGHEQRLRRLEIEHPNLIAALAWLDRRGDMEGLLRLAAANGGIALTSGRFREGRDWLERGLARAPVAPSPVRGRAMISLGRLVSLFDEVERAEALLTGGIAALDPKADALVVAFAYIRLGAVANQLGEHDRAERMLDRALASVDDIQDPVSATTVAITVLGNLGVVAQGQGKLDLARTRYEQALAMSREHNHSFGIVRYLRDLGDVDRDRGDFVASLASYKQCLAVLDWLIEPRVLVDVLEGAALAAAVWQEPGKAARLLGAAEAQRDQYGGTFIVPADAAAHQRALAVIRAALSEAAIEEAWGAGRGLSVPEAVAEVQSLVPPDGVATPANPAEGVVRLSPREMDVLRLLAEGHSDREIAERLYLSVRTVEAPVAWILAKIGVRTRTAAVGAAIAAGLVEPVRRN